MGNEANTEAAYLKGYVRALRDTAEKLLARAAELEKQRSGNSGSSTAVISLSTR